MAFSKNPKRDRKLAAIKLVLDAQERPFVDPVVLYGRAAGDDLAHYSDADLAAMAIHARSEIAAFEDHAARITIANPEGLSVEGQAISVLSVTDRNMPFLYDSVIGAVAASHRTLFLAVHPILDTRNIDRIQLVTGTSDCPQDKRVSHIQVHLPALSTSEAERLIANLREVLGQVHAAVGDWRPMLDKLERAMATMKRAKTTARADERREALAFLDWLREGNFTFLGMRDYVYSADGGEAKVERAAEDGIGILADPDMRVLRLGKDHVTTTPEIVAFLEGPDWLIVTKANTRSQVHRRAYMDYIGVKLFDEAGEVSGELRIVGLFTSTAYTRSVTEIPLLRTKVEAVVDKLGFDPESHSGKMLFNTLESYPRDDLFQIDVDTLVDYCVQINELSDRPRVRVLARIDRFDRFVSVIVYVPRDQYDSDVRERIGAALAERFDGHVSAYYPAFPEGNLARVHFIVGRRGGKTPRVAQEKLEQDIRAIVTRWEDRFAMEKAPDAPLLDVSQAFRERFTPSEALGDLDRILACAEPGGIAIDLMASREGDPGRLTLKIFHAQEAVALSRRVPLLENLGFRVISERTFDIAVRNDDRAPFDVVLHEMELEPAGGAEASANERLDMVEDAFLKAWHGETDNDAFNMLVLGAGLDARRVVVLRAYARYLRQLGSTYSQTYIAGTLGRYPDIASLLYQLFEARFTLDLALDKRDRHVAALRKKIAAALEAVTRLEDDRILRRYENAIMATLRTNYFQTEEDGQPRRTLAFKVNPRALDAAPAPRPFREIFVYGSEVEGVHMRFGPVARGGLRWSDRPEDYRTEVLGLVKAQQVKNAVIVPVGAKGGFFPKRLPETGDRNAIFEAGKSAYKTFIRTLLSVTDNIDGDAVVPPKDVVRHDGDDPYFVVAADKGTATFSDTANAISQEQGFWLDDAFASGGSAGYDHKKMGITARGAWETAKRHFREMNIDIQSTPFSVAGVGDMSGDVFGNGMLLSKHIRLIAAFDHRDIIIDPDPDTARSFEERQRLFDLPRSSWQDYDRARLSKGGMIVSRSEKSVKLTPEAARAIGLATTIASPPEIMTAILKAPVDLLWFGGIGTYVKAAEENDADVGDRANDAIRVTAGEVGAKVIGEGANLGVTQRGRIAYALAGGRCNSDAIDNSAGVNSSDVEVNIKIALASAMRQEKLTRTERNRLLVSMTDDVARLVLRNNYLQSLAISLQERAGADASPQLAELMDGMERAGRLDRKVETLPDRQLFEERQRNGKPLTRPEIGVLLSYAKIGLFDDLMASSLPADAYFMPTLKSYFPKRMQRDFGDEIAGHRLNEEIVATELANAVINRGGPAFVSMFADIGGAMPGDVVRAFVIARDGLELEALYDRIDALDGKIDGRDQNTLYAAVGFALAMTTGRILRSMDRSQPLADKVAAIRDAARALKPTIEQALSPFLREETARQRKSFEQTGAPADLARDLALLQTLVLVPEIEEIARACGVDLKKASRQFFAVNDTFRIGRIEAAALRIDDRDRYATLALARNLNAIHAARRTITTAAISGFADERNPVEAWIASDRIRVERLRDQIMALAEDSAFDMSRLTVAAGMLSDVAPQSRPPAGV